MLNDMRVANKTYLFTGIMDLMTAVFDDLLWAVHYAVAYSFERRRLYMELSQLNRGELADLRLQPRDIIRLVRGQAVPALSYHHSR